jgi:hypothetical protein
MKIILSIAISVLLLMSINSCQDTLGIDDYKKTLVASDTTFVFLSDTIIIDTLIRDTVTLEKVIKDTVFLNDTVWKEVYHSYSELIINDGYIANDRVFEDLPFYYETEYGKITYTKELNKQIAFIDLNVNNIYYNFYDFYQTRDEIITNFKIKLNDYQIKVGNTVSLNSESKTNKYAEITQLNRHMETTKYLGSDYQMLLTTYSAQQNHLGETSSATLVFSALIDAQDIIYDWMVLNAVIYLRF